MTKNNTKELTFTSVKKNAKEKEITETHYLDDNTYITYNPKFSNTKLQTMFGKFAQVIPSPEDAFQLSEVQINNLLFLHLIRTFTSIGKTLKGETLGEQLKELKVVIDAEYDDKSLFKIIVDELFDINEIHKVNDMLNDSLATNEAIQQVTDEQALLFSELQVENPEILNVNFNSEQ